MYVPLKGTSPALIRAGRLKKLVQEQHGLRVWKQNTGVEVSKPTSTAKLKKASSIITVTGRSDLLLSLPDITISLKSGLLTAFAPFITSSKLSPEAGFSKSTPSGIDSY